MLQTCKLARVCVASGVLSAKGVGRLLKKDNRKELASKEGRLIRE
jgi:hypothetical protein